MRNGDGSRVLEDLTHAGLDSLIPVTATNASAHVRDRGWCSERNGRLGIKRGRAFVCQYKVRSPK
jgi:hypothetical protein